MILIYIVFVFLFQKKAFAQTPTMIVCGEHDTIVPVFSIQSHQNQ